MGFTENVILALFRSIITGKLSLKLDKLSKWIEEREQELTTELPQLNNWETEKVKNTLTPYTEKIKVIYCLQFNFDIFDSTLLFIKSF